jgi:GxxExxY protein
MKSELPHGNITEAVIGAAFEVHKTLGYGFLEAVYRNAMMVELRVRGVSVEMEKRVEVRYKNEPVGVYIADIVAGGKVLVELKVAEDYRRGMRHSCSMNLRLRVFLWDCSSILEDERSSSSGWFGSSRSRFDRVR